MIPINVMTEFTKGEWWVEFHDCHTTVEAESQTICTDVSNCDANLIAASKDMYEALKGLLRDYSTNPNSDIFYAACLKAREALSKAEGSHKED